MFTVPINLILDPLIAVDDTETGDRSLAIILYSAQYVLHVVGHRFATKVQINDGNDVAANGIPEISLTHHVRVGGYTGIRRAIHAAHSLHRVYPLFFVRSNAAGSYRVGLVFPST